mmetsp:Transcript_9861/g.13646  ORF Transcript_9861/g.13646 Transcript_9861/m.13646 type:complete len:81 (-) Transcript_9861:679-921(-)
MSVMIDKTALREDMHVNLVGQINDDDDYRRDDHGEIGDDPRSDEQRDGYQQKPCYDRGTSPFLSHASWGQQRHRRDYGRL